MDSKEETRVIHLKSSGLLWALLGRAGAWGPRASHPVGTARRQHLIFTVSFSASTAPSTADAQGTSLLYCAHGVQAREKLGLQCWLWRKTNHLDWDA